MEFWITIVGLVRRKRVIIPALLAAMALAAVAYLITPISYTSSATMVLTTTQYGGTESRDPTQPTDLTNPMLNFNDSLTTTSAILIEAMNTAAVETKLGATGATQLIVDDGRSNPSLLGLNGPFLYIVGRSTSPENAERVVPDAQTLMREKLQDWQRALNAPKKTYVSIADVVPPSAAQPDRARAIKHALLAFIFGLFLFMGIAYLWHQHRARRRVVGASRLTTSPAATLSDEGLPDPLPSPVPEPVLEVEEGVEAPGVVAPLRNSTQTAQETMLRDDDDLDSPDAVAPAGDAQPAALEPSLEVGEGVDGPGVVTPLKSLPPPTPHVGDSMDEDLDPPAVQATLKKRSGPAMVSTHLRQKAQPPSVRKRKSASSVVRAPVKTNVRSRNR